MMNNSRTPLPNNIDGYIQVLLRPNEVQRAVAKLVDNKSCGLDGITAEHLKYADVSIVPLLAMCFTGLHSWSYLLSKQSPNDFKGTIYGHIADKDKKKFDVVVQKLDTLFTGKKKSVFARYKFWALKRTETTFDEYLSHLQTAAQQCEFAEKDLMIKDKIIFSLTLQPLKEKLLREGNATLAATIDACCASELAQISLVLITLQEKEDVDCFHNAS
ncbi:hypothetical protein CAPTEDRAFT_190957 [Capitella teleta]|uniref:Retrotransposon gag domain-containing protein n=1 Tax=Capitella teleta TaxID=283909 RepID=R7TIY3_CAPTE|nr:hypothetical protein CAPTEDRAFT_190957 [Capitella teleta]|eukprot:ELT93778.1 hypothetical protein CAPTEDRAFT_190957 [Capitella teleta]